MADVTATGWTPRQRLVLTAVLIVAALLRLVQLGLEGLWFDEAHSVLIAERGVAGMVADLDNQAPLYFVLLAATVRAIGTSEVAVRLPSAAASFATVWLVAVIGRSLLGPAAGLLAAWLLTVSPMAVHYAQEARPYALLTLLVVTFFGALEHTARTDSAGWLAIAAVTGAAVVLTHNLGVFYVLGVMVAVVVSGWPLERRAATRIVLAGAVVAVTAAFWGYRVLGQIATLADNFSWAAGLWRDEFPWQLPRSIAALGHGSLEPVRNRVGFLTAQAWAGSGLTIVLAAAAVGRREPVGSGERRRAAAVAAATVVPLAGIFVASLVAPVPLYVVGRIDSPAVPFLMLLVAAGATTVAGRVGPWLVAVACAGLAVLPLEVHFRIDFRSQDRQFAAAFGNEWRPGEVVVAGYFQHSLEVYLGRLPGMVMLRYPSDPLRPDPAIWDATAGRALAAPVLARALELAAASGRPRLWVVTRPGTPIEVIADLAAAQLPRVVRLEDPRIPTVADAFALVPVPESVDSDREPGS